MYRANGVSFGLSLVGNPFFDVTPHVLITLNPKSPPPMAQGWSLKQALEFVTQQRPQVSPNAGFMARLIRLEQSLHGTKTVTVTSPYHCMHSMCSAPCDRCWMTIFCSVSQVSVQSLSTAVTETQSVWCADAAEEDQAGAAHLPCVRGQGRHQPAVPGVAHTHKAP